MKENQMNFQIKKRFSETVIFECKLSKKIAPLAYEFRLGFAIKKAIKANVSLANTCLAHANVEGEDLTGADFSEADLMGVDFSSANLTGVKLEGADFWDTKWTNGITISRCPIQVFGLAYPITILDHHMQIGCEMHTLAAWAAFNNRRILAMDGAAAAKFWNRHKTALLALAASDGRRVAR